MISVIIPTYNCAEYIGEAIDSVLAQTYKDIEIIVVDDGSSDNTGRIIESYSSRYPNIHYIRQNNSGPGAARNTGIKQAHGEYIAFLDADDALTANSVEMRLNLFKSVEGVDLVFSDYFYQSIDGHGNISNSKAILLNQIPNIVRRGSHGIVFSVDSFSDLFEGFIIAMDTAMVKRSAFERVGYFRTDISVGEDIDMWLKLMKQGSIGYIDMPLAYYKRFRGNLTSGDPLEYARNRFKFLHPLLEENINNHKIFRIIEKQLAWVHYDLGCYYINQNMGFSARLNLLKSIYYDPKNKLPYKALAASCIPSILKTGLKRLRKKPEPALT